MLNTIFHDIKEVLAFLPICLVIGLFLLFFFLLWKGMDYLKYYPIQTFCIFLLFTYLSAICFITLLSREPGTRQAIDLKLFSTWGKSTQEKAYVLENIILFIPLGFLLPPAFPLFSSPIRILAVSYLLSFFIEVTQLLTQRGFCQVDDFLTNVFGALIGFFLIKLTYAIRFPKNFLSSITKI